MKRNREWIIEVKKRLNDALLEKNVSIFHMVRDLEEAGISISYNTMRGTFDMSSANVNFYAFAAACAYLGLDADRCLFGDGERHYPCDSS